MKEIFFSLKKTSHERPLLGLGSLWRSQTPKMQFPSWPPLTMATFLDHSWGGPHGRPQSHSGLGALTKEIFVVLRKTSRDTPKDTIWAVPETHLQRQYGPQAAPVGDPGRSRVTTRLAEKADFERTQTTLRTNSTTRLATTTTDLFQRAVTFSRENRGHVANVR